MELKRTALFEAHKSLGAKLVDFGGWEMPIQYGSIIDEHNATREHAGLFDVSHMGEIGVSGKGCGEALNRLVTNDVAAMISKKVIYSLIPNEHGGVVDDLLIYMLGEDDFLLVVNASNTDKDFAWFTEKFHEIDPDIKVVNLSSRYGQIAVQGPLAQEILQSICDFDLNGIKFFYFERLSLLGAETIVSRTGYTGEDGFEIYCETADSEKLWNALLAAGKDKGLLPVGLGARDTLRFEAGLPLYGHELGDDISPIESSLKFFVKLDKPDFIGRDTILRHAENGTETRLAGIELIERGIPRPGCRVEKDGVDIGYCASGTHSPTFRKGLATAFIKTEFAAPGTEIDVIIRDKAVKAKVVKLPFYKKKTKKI